MPLRPPAGFIRPGYDPLKVPDAPTIGTATGGDARRQLRLPLRPMLVAPLFPRITLFPVPVRLHLLGHPLRSQSRG